MLEVVPAIGTESGGKRFNSSYFSLKKLKTNEQSEIILGLCMKSMLRIKYFISLETSGSRRRSSSTDTAKKISGLVDNSNPIFKDLNKAERESRFKLTNSSSKEITNDDDNHVTNKNMLNDTNDKHNSMKEKNNFTPSPCKTKMHSRTTFVSKNLFGGIPTSSSSSSSNNKNTEIADNEVKLNKKSISSKDPSLGTPKLKISSKTDFLKSKTVQEDSNFKTIKTTILEPKKTTLEANTVINQHKFCSAFFISSIPQTNINIFEKTEGVISDCGHKECSQVPSYIPEVIYTFSRLPEKELPFNNEFAKFCFPKGIKLCYSESEKDLKYPKNFSTTITNEFGSTFYLMNYHFYYKIESQTFISQYKNIYQSLLQVEKIAETYNKDPSKTKDIEQAFVNKLQIIEKLSVKDTIYIPICFTLISKFPYLKLMEKTLESLIKVSIDTKLNQDDLLKFLSHIIYEVPVPPNDKKLIFYLPHLINPLELHPLMQNERRLNNFNVKIILDLLSIENIIMVFNLMVMEQKIIFIHEDREKLSEVIDCFLSLLYPFKWTHTNIRILPDDYLKFLESFLPFIMGMEENSFSNIKCFSEDDSQIIYVLNIRKNSLYVIGGKKITKITKL